MISGYYQIITWLYPSILTNKRILYIIVLLFFERFRYVHIYKYTPNAIILLFSYLSVRHTLFPERLSRQSLINCHVMIMMMIMYSKAPSVKTRHASLLRKCRFMSTDMLLTRSWRITRLLTPRGNRSLAELCGSTNQRLIRAYGGGMTGESIQLRLIVSI